MACILCNRDLTDPVSAQRGMGDDCAKKYQRYMAACGTSEAEIGALMMSNDPTVQRWVRKFAAATADNNLRYAQLFINAARKAAQPAELAA